MKKVGIITFHASHNYGSMLQAFALQTTLTKIGFDTKIINFRNQTQKNLYSLYADKRARTIKNVIKNIIVMPYKKALKNKYTKFENFIKIYLNTTKEYNTLEELYKADFDFDYYIAGSDQIWNTKCFDFDLAYLLPFVKNGKKIAYAPSLGPIKNNYDTLAKYIKTFDIVSIREKQNFYSIDNILRTDTFVALDPTLLLTKDDWNKYISKKPLLNYEYIFLYTLEYNKDILNEVDSLQKKLKIPVVISNISGFKTLLKNYNKIFDIGPLEFLNLIKNARIVVSGSFHAMLFSMLFNKEVVIPTLQKDYRMITLINKFKNIEDEREKSLMFLKEALK